MKASGRAAVAAVALGALSVTVRRLAALSNTQMHRINQDARLAPAPPSGAIPTLVGPDPTPDHHVERTSNT